MSDKDERDELLEGMDPKEFVKELGKAISDQMMKYFKRDEKGRLWLVDEHGSKVKQLVGYEASTKSETLDDREVIKEASQMSLQKKEKRLMINLPAWLKERLKTKSNRTGKSMNEIIRIALTEYLSK